MISLEVTLEYLLVPGTSNSGFFRVGTGDYQVDIKQESTARVSLVSAPGTLAIAGLGLLGLAAARRRKS